MHLLLDIGAAFVLISAVLYGMRKGLILTAAGIIITIVSIIAAWALATAFSPMISKTLEDNLAPMIDFAVTAAITEGADMLPDMSSFSGENVTSALDEALKSLGVSQNSDNVIANAIVRKMHETGESLKTAALTTICNAVAFAGAFLLGFLLIRFILEVVAHMISGLFKLPGLKFFNKMGGAAIGLLEGVIILSVLCWGLQFIGLWIPGEALEQTVVAKYFMNLKALDFLTVKLAGIL